MDVRCVVDGGGRVLCWVDKFDGPDPKPREVEAAHCATDVSLTWDQGCAPLANGDVKCWPLHGPHAYDPETMRGMPCDVDRIYDAAHLRRHQEGGCLVLGA